MAFAASAPAADDGHRKAVGGLLLPARHVRQERRARPARRVGKEQEQRPAAVAKIVEGPNPPVEPAGRKGGSRGADWQACRCGGALAGARIALLELLETQQQPALLPP